MNREIDVCFVSLIIIFPINFSITVITFDQLDSDTQGHIIILFIGCISVKLQFYQQKKRLLQSLVQEIEAERGKNSPGRSQLLIHGQEGIWISIPTLAIQDKDSFLTTATPALLILLLPPVFSPSLKAVLQMFEYHQEASLHFNALKYLTNPQTQGNSALGLAIQTDTPTSLPQPQTPSFCALKPDLSLH